jgi:predicted Zn-dependent protease with MMP-like domain
MSGKASAVGAPQSPKHLFWGSNGIPYFLRSADYAYDRLRSAGGVERSDKMEETFEQIVEWAYSTLPQKIRRLPDFPGIQVVDEPPPDVLRDMAAREKWRHGTELLGLYSGTFRTKRSFTQLKYAPDLIFVFRGPILRCSKGDLRAEVKQVVWHEVAHWLGFETEEQVEALGL